MSDQLTEAYEKWAHRPDLPKGRCDEWTVFKAGFAAGQVVALEDAAERLNLQKITGAEAINYLVAKATQIADQA